MKATTKRTIQNLFVGQVSNARAIEGAKTAPWWIAVILFLIGTFLPVVPIMVTQGNAYGAQFISGEVFKYDEYMTRTTVDLANDTNYSYKIVNHKLLKYDSLGNQVKDNTWSLDGDNQPLDMTPIAKYEEKRKITIEEVEQDQIFRVFNVYYTNRPYSNNGDNTIAQMLKTLTGRYYEKNALTPTIYNGQVDDKTKNDLYYNPSFLVLAEDGIYSYIYKTDSLTLASYTGAGFDWAKQEDTAEGKNFLQEVANVPGIAQDIKNDLYVKGVFENWKTVYNKAFSSLRHRNFWMLTGIFYGIFVALNLFMGLMLWLLTRGKRNPNRGLRIDTCLRIAGWICFLPGLLALAFGFLIPAAQQILFIMLIGLRTMWLAMRQLNPKY